MAVRRIASKASRDVRKFWLKINKVVAFKQKTEADEIRQKVTATITLTFNKHEQLLLL